MHRRLAWLIAALWALLLTVNNLSAASSSLYPASPISGAATQPAPPGPAVPVPPLRGLMRPDQATLRRWTQWSREAPRADTRPRVRGAASSSAKSLLAHLSYDPAQRNQGSCGNCWAWAGTGVLEIALSVQEGITDRLSLQFPSSCYNEGANEGCVCCGGWLETLADWYQHTGYALPWDNASANWVDSSRLCDQGHCDDTAAVCNEISTTPRYPISQCTMETIATFELPQEQAIAHIKSVLDQDRAVWFALFMPTAEEWAGFSDFWWNQPESAVWNPSYTPGKAWDENAGAGHALLCVGYDDTDPANPYWLMVNSWGTTPNRPHGLLRVALKMDYSDYLAFDDSLFQSFFWQTLAVEFGEPAVTPTRNPTPPLDPFFWQEEAEQGELTTPMAVSGDGAASACGYVASPLNSTGSVAFTFQVPAPGYYYPWAHLMGAAPNQNSFYVSLDGSADLHVEIPQFEGQWAWVWSPLYAADGAPAPQYLQAGTHVLRFRAREPYARLDAVAITSQPGPVPWEVKPCDQPAPTPSPTPGATPPRPPFVWQAEAEQGSVLPLLLVAQDEQASGCGYVYGIQNSHGSTTFSLNVPSGGLYYLWARSMGLAYHQNSFFVSFDGAREFHYEIPQFDGAWTWGWNPVHPSDQGITPIFLAAGRHTVCFRARETYARLDTVLLTDSRTYTPVEFSACQLSDPTPTPSVTPSPSTTPTLDPTPTATASTTPATPPSATPSPPPSPTPFPVTLWLPLIAIAR